MSEPPSRKSIVPARYTCYRACDPIVVDGRLTEPAWKRAPRTTSFVDIATGEKAFFDTRAMMLWDDTYWYIGVTCEEPDVWSTFIRRHSIIYYDNDIEVFVDPDGDGSSYHELEINALNTVWCQVLGERNSTAARACSTWDVKGLKHAVQIDGTLNWPEDKDRGWTVEIAFPWRSFAEFCQVPSPPRAGDVWRTNFSRVEYRTDRVGAAYREKDIEGRKAVISQGTQDNWVWSIQGQVNMHLPGRWGYVQFSGESV